MKKLVTLTLAVSASFALGQTRAQIESELSHLSQIGKQKGWTFHLRYHKALEIPLELRTGLRRSPDWKSKARWVKASPTPGTLPAKWDWREHAGVLPAVQNQGNCGSCWAFGTSASFESAIALASKKMVGISEQQLVDCDNDFNGCGGGDFAFDFWKSTGAAHKDEYPYVGYGQWCKNDAPQHEMVVKWSYVGSPDREPTTDEIKAAIYTHGAVAVTVAADGSFGGYGDGVYNACDSDNVDHIVALVGWDDSTQSWILRNSWGEDWGEKGYMRIRYTDDNGSKCNAVGGSAAYAEVIKQ